MDEFVASGLQVKRLVFTEFSRANGKYNRSISPTRKMFRTKKIRPLQLCLYQLSTQNYIKRDIPNFFFLPHSRIWLINEIDRSIREKHYIPNFNQIHCVSLHIFWFAPLNPPFPNIRSKLNKYGTTMEVHIIVSFD